MVLHLRPCTCGPAPAALHLHRAVLEHCNPPSLPVPRHCVLLAGPQDKESATIPELILLSAPDAHILLLAFTAGAAAALGLVRPCMASRSAAQGSYSGQLHAHSLPPCTAALTELPADHCPGPASETLPLQAAIPYYTGKIIDYASIDPDPHEFKLTTLKMLGVALACAVFTGIRGGLFTVRRGGATGEGG